MSKIAWRMGSKENKWEEGWRERIGQGGVEGEGEVEGGIEEGEMGLGRGGKAGGTSTLLALQQNDSSAVMIVTCGSHSPQSPWWPNAKGGKLLAGSVSAPSSVSAPAGSMAAECSSH